MSKRHQAFVIWSDDIEEGDKPTPYEFNTEEELNAFLLGVSEASGCMSSAVFLDEQEAEDYIREQLEEGDGVFGLY